MMNELIRSQWGLAIVRILLGIIFIAHGSQKVLGIFGGNGLTAFATWVSNSYHVPLFIGYAAAFFEFIGGILLLTGIAAEFGALLVIPVMAGAIYFVHGSKGFFGQNGGYEYPLCLLILAVAIIIGGPGKFALWPHSFFIIKK